MEEPASTVPNHATSATEIISADTTSNDEISNGSEHGSSVKEAIFNFTNSIVGAGCIGLGGAIASSGGMISIALIVFFAILTKLSLDLLIRLSIEHSTTAMTASYEDLAQAGMGYWKGRVLVMICKLSYSFGCLVAYIIVIKDNCGPALKSLIYGEGDGDGEDMYNNIDTETDANDHHDGHQENWFYWLLSKDYMVTWVLSFAFILPLCLLRDMTPLAFGSLISVASMITIVGIVIYIYFECPDVRQEPTGGFYENWVEIRPGVLSNLGTFIFTFVSQHTVHLVFSSLKPPLRKIEKWKTVSSLSIFAAATVSLLVGVFVYITFWQNTKSDIFQIYPHGWMIDTAKLLLCITMVFTFPLPFFTCRELFILTVMHPICGIGRERISLEHEARDDEHGTTNDSVGVGLGSPQENETEDMADLQRPLLSEESSSGGENDNYVSYTSVETSTSHQILSTDTTKNWLLPDDDRQLCLMGHICITVQIWLIVTGLAIAAPSLGDILDLVGCASGTLIAFVIPGLLSFYIEGYSHLAMVILTVGGVVGTVGTYFSIKQLVADI
jgi:amino acid permease